MAVPTKDVFAALKDRSGVGDGIAARPLSATPPTCCASWKPPATTWKRRRSRIQPVIGEVLAAIAALPGALLARMSGSGATCFGIFADDDCCARAAESLKQSHPDWWIAPTFVPEAGIVHEATGQDIGPTPDGL